MKIFPYELSAHLQITDEDASDFLQSQFSQDLSRLTPGQAVYGLWLDVKGKVVADSWVLFEGPECFRVFSEHCPPELIADKLKRHIIADDVEIEILPPAPAVAIVGLPEVPAVDGAEPVFQLPGRRAVESSQELVFASPADRETFVDGVKAEVVSRNQIQLLRMEAGIPLVPLEVGPGELPGEGGLDLDAVAFDKGCFLGQEVVARMRNVGKATRGLYLIQGDGNPPECPQSLSNSDGKAVGELRSAYPDKNGWRGVALLKLRHVATAGELQLASGPVRVEASFQDLNKHRSHG